MDETWEVLNDPETVTAIEEGEAAIAAGRTVSLEEFRAIPTQRPGVEWHRATWVLVVVAVCGGPAFVGWVFWYVFVESKR